jgi:outer membrane protein assembly factor BamB
MREVCIMMRTIKGGLVSLFVLLAALGCTFGVAATDNPKMVINWSRNGLSSIPVVIAGDNIIAVSGSSLLLLDNSGTTIWSWEAEGNILSIAYSRDNGISAASEDVIYRISKNGTKIWSFKSRSRVITLEEVADGKLAVGTTLGAILLSEKGELLWEYDPSSNCAT